MKEISKPVSKWLHTVFGDIRSAIIGAIVFYILSTTGILLLINKLWHGLQKPIPLWIVILISLTILFGCSILFLIHSYRLSNKSNYKIRYFTIGTFKWKTKVYDYGSFGVDEYPFCIKHDLQFIYGDRTKYCPGTEKEACNNHIHNDDFFLIYESTKSNIDKLIRNKTY